MNASSPTLVGYDLSREEACKCACGVAKAMEHVCVRLELPSNEQLMHKRSKERQE